MKVVVLGAAGAMAAVAIRDLLEFCQDVEITAADPRPVDINDRRVRSVTVDVRDIRSTTEIIERHDVALNCVTYYYNVNVMRACLAARVPYVDLGGLYHGTLNQFELHDEFRNAGVPALLGMGSTPGITNVMAGAVARTMDRVDEIHVRVACHDESASGPLPVPYSLDTILDEFALEPMVFHDGKPAPVRPMSGSEVLDAPRPAGRMEALYTLHSEVAMFPRSFPTLKEASFKVAFPPAFVEKMRFLVELGFASRDKAIQDVSPRQMLLTLASRQRTPIDTQPRDCDFLRVEVKGTRKGIETSAIAESVILPHKGWKIAAGALDTGVPLSIAGQMLARRTIHEPGVLCPELAVQPDLFFSELELRGIKISLRHQPSID